MSIHNLTRPRSCLVTLDDYRNTFAWFGFSRSKVFKGEPGQLVLRVPNPSFAFREYVGDRVSAGLCVAFQTLRWWECWFVRHQSIRKRPK